jgi:hypothetical protein
MAEQQDGREYLIIPTAEELADAWQQYRSLVVRRAERGQVTEVGGESRVNGFINSDQILASNPHLQVGLEETGAKLSANLEAGRISAEEVYRLGARYILEMFAIATTVYEANQIADEM